MVILFIGSFIVPESAVVAVVSGFVFAIGQGLQLGSVTVFLADTVDYGEYKLENEMKVSHFHARHF